LLGCLLFIVYSRSQACVVAEYPSQLTLSGLVNLAGGLQCAVISLIFEKPAALRLRWDLQLLAIAYSGIFCGGLGVFAMMWCVKETGPVYVTAFSPMSTVMVAIREGAIAASCATHLEQPDRHGLGHRRSLLVSVGQKLKKWRVFCCNSRREGEWDRNETSVYEEPSNQEESLLAETRKCLI
ncbi:hypothetical protein BHE74_00023797, partial [Ensete ventricosum]